MGPKNWGTVSLAALALVGLAIIVTAGWFIYLGSQWEGAYEVQAAEKSQSAYDSARKQVLQRCGPLSPTEKYDCEREIEETHRDNQREIKDLEAQRVTALWTSYMGAAALLGMAVSVIGVILVFFTFKESRRAADETRRSVDAFMEAERARLHVVRPEYAGVAEEHPDPPHLWVSVHVANYGRSPCRVRKLYYGVLDDVKWHEEFKWRGHTIAPVDIVVPPDTEPHFACRMLVPRGRPFVGGHILYDTQFKKGCKSYFLWNTQTSGEDGGVYVSNQQGEGWPEDT